MEQTNSIERRYGLLGRNISYSFSKGYFSAKFKNMGLTQVEYVNFDLDSLNGFKENVRHQLPELSGLNVTIPYKEEVMDHLDSLDPEAEEIGAVNTIKILEDGSLKGFNTDVFGFQESLMSIQGDQKERALILGTGGASKAVHYVLKKLNTETVFVSRTKGAGQITYTDLNKELIESHELIVNCSPSGTFPEVEKRPDIPYHCIGRKHILYDLIYNPPKTKFLQLGELKGAQIMNGLSMLELQAERSWKIWNDLI